MSDSLERLFEAVMAAERRDPAFSRTAKLMREGVVKMAKKLAEEAVEVGLDAVQGDRDRVVEESADLLYNLVVLWAKTGILPCEVWAEMERRERMLGIAEKLPKPDVSRQSVAEQDLISQDLINQDLINQDLISQDPRRREMGREGLCKPNLGKPGLTKPDVAKPTRTSVVEMRVRTARRAR